MLANLIPPQEKTPQSAQQVMSQAESAPAGDNPQIPAIKLDLNDLDLEETSEKSNRATVDLVRLYLQDIGRVPLLKKDEEVQQAQQIQRHLQLIQLREVVRDSDPIIDQFVNLMEIQERLASQLGHRPSLGKWAKNAEMSVIDLKKAVSLGKHRWAEIAGIDVQTLEKIQKLGKKAKENMISANLRLVVSVAKKYQHRGLELLDLIQEGTLGLERAVEKFDPTKGYRFSTYAYWWIRQGITRAIATQSRMIRLPVHITEKLNRIRRAQRTIAEAKGRTAKIEEIAQELELTPEQVRETLSKIPRSVSLEIKVGKEKDTELVDLLETDAASPEEILISEGLRRDVQSLLDELTDREREVIELRYGFKEGTMHSLTEIGRILDLSRERVRQIESKALQKLRQPRRRNLVRDYVDALN